MANITGTADDDTLEGTADADVIMGLAGRDDLYGFGGADTLIGGLGDDFYYIDNLDTIVEAANGGDDWLMVTGSYSLAGLVHVENMQTTQFVSGGVTLTGNDGNNRLYGTSFNADSLFGGRGDDILAGNGGGDTLVGGLGDDTYVSVGGSDTVVEAADEGVDTFTHQIFAPRSFTLAGFANVENLEVLVGSVSAHATLVGNALNNALRVSSLATPTNDTLSGGDGNDDLDGSLGNDNLFGDAGNDVLHGEYGNDTLNGGDGIDTASYGYASSAVNVSLLLQNAEQDTLSGGLDILISIENLMGSAFADTLIGDAGANTLDGGADADAMTGGAGNDTYALNNTGDVITELADQGTDRVNAFISHTLAANVEILTLKGNAGISAKGNGLNNTITGNDAINTLDGKTGADTMSGGKGNDTYVVENAGDIVIELAGQGADTVSAYIDYTLGDNVEVLKLGGSTNLNGTGNALNNRLVGNDGNNTLDGAGGADLMLGGNGGDTYVVNDVGDVVTETAASGRDRVNTTISYTLTDHVEILSLRGGANLGGTGNTLDNTLLGNSGNNTLNGKEGADILTGGAGNDLFRFDTALSAGNVDAVTDFVRGQDKVQLENSVFTALTATGTLAAAAFNTGAAATDASDRIIYDSATGALIYDADGTGAAAAFHFATLGAGLALTNTDILVT